MRYFVTIGSRTFEVDLSGGIPRVDGTPVEAELATVPGTPVHHLLADGRSHAFVARPLGRRGRWELSTDGGVFEVEALDERTRVIQELTGSGSAVAEKVLRAPMPGLVMRVEVEVGQTVKAGQGVVIVEAMKMENELKSPAEGVVAEIRCQAGQAVEKGATLLVFE
jgi:biotin carboxyl carrier protein